MLYLYLIRKIWTPSLVQYVVIITIELLYLVISFSSLLILCYIANVSLATLDISYRSSAFTFYVESAFLLTKTIFAFVMINLISF